VMAHLNVKKPAFHGKEKSNPRSLKRKRDVEECEKLQQSVQDLVSSYSAIQDYIAYG
jgi:hypothetical protein